MQICYLLDMNDKILAFFFYETHEIELCSHEFEVDFDGDMLR